MQGVLINNFKQAANVNLFHNDKQTLQTSVYTLGKDGMQIGLHTNTEKTEIMVFGNEATDLELKTNISDQTKEVEPKFCYLSSTLTWNNNCSVEINTVHGLQGVKVSWHNLTKHGKTETAITKQIINTRRSRPPCLRDFNNQKKTKKYWLLKFIATGDYR